MGFLHRFFTVAVILLQLLHFCSCEFENFDDGQSQLGLVYMAHIDELEFRLKERIVNETFKIEPTKTVIPNDAGLFNSTKEEFVEVVWDKFPVPIVNAFYSFDRSAVEILLNFVETPGNIDKLSIQHLQLIKKYIYEWYEVIQEPQHEEDFEMFDEELVLLKSHISKSMGFQDIVVRNIIRIQLDLQKILEYSEDELWQEQVVHKVSEAEAIAGIDSFKQGERGIASLTLAQLSSTFNLHPFELYPQNIDKDTAFRSFVHAAINSFYRMHMSLALEWLEAASRLEDVSKVREEVNSQYASIPQYLLPEENYASKIRIMREEFEYGKKAEVKKQKEKLDRIFHSEKDSDERNSKHTFDESIKQKTDKLYLGIVAKVTAILHDQRWNNGEVEPSLGYFSKPVKEENVAKQSAKRAKEDFIQNFPKTNLDQDLKIKYEMLCRGMGIRSIKDMSKYSCHLDSRNSSFLLLMPVKVEVLNNDPEVMIFHDIIGKNKITNFQQMTLPIASTSKTQSHDTESTEVQSMFFRKSYLAWLHEQSSKEVLSLNHLVSHITGYIATDKYNAAESLQVNSYISGGYYVPHIDAFNIFEEFYDSEDKAVRDSVNELHAKGDRIATFMIYMNDDLIGGKTIFPHLNIAASPETGSAIYWRNLYLNGSIHRDTLHSGCQVLAGTKWVANKWIRSNAQMFLRPCALDKNM